MNEKEISLSETRNGLKRKLKADLDEFRHLEKLDEVIFSLIQMKELEFYEKFLKKLGIDIYSLKRETLRIGHPFKELEANGPVLRMASSILHDPTLYFSPFENPFQLKGHLVVYPQVYFLYKMLESTYLWSTDDKSGEIDFRRVYSSGIAENVLLKLDKFEEISKSSEIEPDFFIQLKKVQWANKRVESFFKQVNNIRKELLYGSFSHHPTFPPIHEIKTNSFFLFLRSRTASPYYEFPLTEDVLLLFLAACSAVNKGENKLDYEDVVKAYKTYFKLLSTDISGLVDELWEEQFNSDNK